MEGKSHQPSLNRLSYSIPDPKFSKPNTHRVFYPIPPCHPSTSSLIKNYRFLLNKQNSFKAHLNPSRPSFTFSKIKNNFHDHRHYKRL